ncbi:hypothetical protein CC86DRAFT_51464 [Ophiobolus disseminans]|uniref:C2H2 type master regulator of conidiophore development brlA n=1 Tax=Ophiobolus disseminans TaxID=1469910 RepID=A0A6A6ZUQ2_9PLEO|nr:hypothetical protein CC86DRAFT_51464 [Ophiobolus disseminans]
MDHTSAGNFMEPFFSDPDSILNPICHYCAIPFYQCIHAMPQAPYVPARMFEYKPQSFHTPLTAADLAPIFAYVEADRQPLMNNYVQNINANETTVQPATVQAYIEDIYTPGDRTGSAPHRRQAPRAAGYPCKHEGCGKTFDRACELNRHRKTHLKRTERPHQCIVCHEGFLYPKDLLRHQNKHIEQRSEQITHVCKHPGCNNGFSRRDNLLRHQRKQHSSMDAAVRASP